LAERGIEVTIDVSRNLVAHRLRGEVSADEIMEAMQRVWDNPDFRPEMSSLVDVREMAPLRGTVDVVAIAKLLKEKSEGMSWGKVAVVVAQPLSYGFTRMFEAYAEPAGLLLQIFYDLGEAKRWLGVDDGDSEDP